MNDKEIFLKAAQGIEERGFVRFTLEERRGGAMCARGAIFWAVTGDPLEWDWAAQHRLEPKIAKAIEVKYADYFAASGGLDHFNLADWNNEPERTKEEVIEAFHLAAAVEDAEAEAAETE